MNGWDMTDIQGIPAEQGVENTQATVGAQGTDHAMTWSAGLPSALDGRSVLTWQQLLDAGISALTEAGVADAELDAWYILAETFHTDRVHFFLDRRRPIFGGKLLKGLPAYRELLLKRMARVPLQQLLGVQDFMGLTFYVDEHVLIPRQDTETLVETVLKEQKETEISVLDMCTGSGCIGISLAVHGGYRCVTAVDKSLEALKIAKKNGKRLFLLRAGSVKAESTQVSKEPWYLRLTTYITSSDSKDIGRISSDAKKQSLLFLESDMFAGLEQSNKYDVIVSNPPYIPSAVIEKLDPEVRDYEPRMALDGAEDGLYFYRILARDSKKYLNEGGSVYYEIGYDQAKAVTALLVDNGYADIRVLKDEPGNDRIVTGVWCKKQEV